MTGPAGADRRVSSPNRVSLSYVVPCDSWGTIAPVAAALCAQTIAAEVELVLVGPSAGVLRPSTGAAPQLAGVTIVEAPLLPMAAARLAGLRAARAPTVVLGETHTYPAPTWAEELVRAAAGGAAAVAPRVTHAGPVGALSWVALVMDYGRWSQPGEGGLEIAPSYNAAWCRETLLREAGDDLAVLLAPGRELSDLLRRRGHRLERCGRAEVAHLNVDLPRHWLAERFLGGRLVAASRGRSWSRVRRALYIVSWPLTAALVVRRTLATVRGLPRPARALPALTVGATVWAAGEAIGYLVGADAAAEERMLEYELHKVRYARHAD